MNERLVDRVLDPKYVEDLRSLDRDELDRRVVEAVEVERQISADRRALHRIIDLLQSEQAARG